MKKFEGLGRSLSKEQMKKVKGGDTYMCFCTKNGEVQSITNVEDPYPCTQGDCFGDVISECWANGGDQVDCMEPL